MITINIRLLPGLGSNEIQNMSNCISVMNLVYELPLTHHQRSQLIVMSQASPWLIFMSQAKSQFDRYEFKPSPVDRRESSQV